MAPVSKGGSPSPNILHGKKARKEVDSEGNNFRTAEQKETIKKTPCLGAGSPETLTTGSLFSLGTMATFLSIATRFALNK
jgi:hypothetical protein